ncbi:MAG: hypothetical protein M1838_000957 [Thelocarpon superellum]|nr:MAG: hypothetical protein M1838_000957 [Thelocarpon superellum]
MGTFLFKWQHPASEVFVTGTFDDWGKTVQLEKVGDGFEKVVHLTKVDHSIYYKFVVDGTWTTDHTAPQETDSENNVNNVLKPENIVKPHGHATTPAAAIMSNVTPESTTAQLASKVPLEGSKEASGATDMPGNFPVTPQQEPSELSVAPIPATDGPGNPVHLPPGAAVPNPSTLTSNTTTSTVAEDGSLPREANGEPQTFGVAPIPATAGAGNPIHLKPGEPVPDSSELTTNTVASTATTDQESYEKGSSALTGAPLVTPGPVAPVPGKAGAAADAMELPPVSKNLIPESSLPITGADGVDPTISSIGPSSTTAGLANQVPLEEPSTASGLPDVVKRSQAKAHVGPEAGSSVEMLKEKGAMEQELLGEVTPAPAAATNGESAMPGVPEVVQESLGEAHRAPEAAANAEAVAEKQQVEGELLKEVKVDESTGESAPTASDPAATAATETSPVTTGVAESTTETASTPAPATDAPSESSTTKKEKRRSGFFGGSSTGETSKDDKRKSGFFRKLSERFRK